MRRAAAERRRDNGLARLRLVRRWLVVGTLSMIGLVSAVLSHALPGRASTSATSGAVSTSGPTSSVSAAGLQPPAQAPTAAQQAPPVQVQTGGS